MSVRRAQKSGFGIGLRNLVVTLSALWVFSIVQWVVLIQAPPILFLTWWLSQSIPFQSISEHLEQLCWKSMQETINCMEGDVLPLQEIDVQEHGANISAAIESKYGQNWRSKPLLFRNMWTQEELSLENRTLSLRGLLLEDMEIPFFTNSSRPGALTPDGYAKISDIVANISSKEMPHKIGTQLFVRRKPQLVYEVAPNHIVTELYGHYFTPPPDRGLFNMNVHPITILFVAKGKEVAVDGDETCQQPNEVVRTDMHCEPIANVMVQLEGEKKVTLISPEYSMHLQPKMSQDGRSYLYSMSSTFDHVPRYIHTIRKGDAIYIPNWTWHRVDYIPSEDVSISGSLFFFNPFDTFRRNPLHTTMAIPNMIKEAAGWKAQ